ncbi:MAG TPA: cation diffusion facilitator family transporter [Gemmatimonadales bacterium]|nr:cation diffusion facilitator family transporter [Gemmatimonadales bacterium]
MGDRASLRRYAAISIVAAVGTIALKGGAYVLTGSVGLLSDALESLVNLAAAIVAFIALSAAARPEDEDHRYGHSKAEYFSSGFEGALIMLAAASIIYTSVVRLLAPRPIHQIEIGAGISVVASIINLLVARTLFRAGRRHQSITLEADAHHLMSDVWTSAGVIIGVSASALTGWQRLDPIIAIAVALNIVRTGVSILRRSLLGLLDTAIPEDLLRRISDIFGRHAADGVRFHALRTRQAGAWRFIDFHVLVPGHWSVQRGHDLLEQIEEEVRGAVPNCSVFTHLEPIEDPASFADVRLERAEDPPRRTSDSP